MFVATRPSPSFSAVFASGCWGRGTHTVLSPDPRLASAAGTRAGTKGAAGRPRPSRGPTPQRLGLGGLSTLPTLLRHPDVPGPGGSPHPRGAARSPAARPPAPPTASRSRRGSGSVAALSADAAAQRPAARRGTAPAARRLAVPGGRGGGGGAERAGGGCEGRGARAPGLEGGRGPVGPEPLNRRRALGLRGEAGRKPRAASRGADRLALDGARPHPQPAGTPDRGGRRAASVSQAAAR